MAIRSRSLIYRFCTTQSCKRWRLPIHPEQVFTANYFQLPRSVNTQISILPRGHQSQHLSPRFLFILCIPISLVHNLSFSCRSEIARLAWLTAEVTRGTLECKVDPPDPPAVGRVPKYPCTTKWVAFRYVGSRMKRLFLS